ncbi:MAG: hypothetical protein K6E63_09370 [Lachnospiraceae bacterium]|nr:hypothetical protein [Lachnospiraceae bacterium]
MRINDQSYNLINTFKNQTAGRGLNMPSGSGKKGNGGITEQWVTGSASLDINSKTDVRKQMQQQLRELFEKERTKQAEAYRDSAIAAAATENEEENKEDKLLNSGKVYNFKEISNKIMRAKTPVSAGQAVMAAKRKISEIKRKLAGGGEDNDELQLALTHARKMEVVAQRKKNNLELEEMVKNTQNRDELFDKMEETASSFETDKIEMLKEEITDKQLDHIEEQGELAREEAKQAREMLDEKLEEVTEEMAEQTSEFIDEMSDEESEMLSETSKMLDQMEVVDPHMNKQEFEKLKLKHRLAEQKALMKADMDYLKEVFKSMENKGISSLSNGSLSGGFAGTVSLAGPVGASAIGAAAIDSDAGIDKEPVHSVDVAV